MTSITNLIRECKDVFGTRKLVWEMGGGVAALVAFMAIAAGFLAIAPSGAPGLSQQAVEPLRVSPLTGFDPTIAKENRHGA